MNEENARFVEAIKTHFCPGESYIGTDSGSFEESLFIPNGAVSVTPTLEELEEAFYSHKCPRPEPFVRKGAVIVVLDVVLPNEALPWVANGIHGGEYICVDVYVRAVTPLGLGWVEVSGEEAVFSWPTLPDRNIP